MFACGRLGEFASGRFRAFQFPKAAFGRAAALENADWPKWVETRRPTLQLRCQKTVVEVSLPRSSHSSPSADDPFRPVGFLLSSHSAKGSLFELGGYKAAAGSFTLPARSGQPKKRSKAGDGAVRMIAD